MISKKVLKDIQSLSLKKHREETGLFVAEGPKIVQELVVTKPHQVEAIYALKSWEGFTTNPKTVEVSDMELDKISLLKTPNQVLAVVRQFPSLPPDVSTFTLYLDAIQDPGNFGTLVRIADWFGIKHIVCSDGCADLYNPKVIQASMASIARVNVFYDEEASWLQNQTVPIFAAALVGKPLPEFVKINNGILIIGNESKGVRDEFRRLASEQITIIRRGEAESLNAAVAAGIILSHLLP